MKLTRRNALLGMGTIAAGAGVVGGSGAFTSVSADREISVSSSGDSEANVDIVVNEVEGLVDSGDNTIGLSFQNLNKNATTAFADALTITPQGGNGPYDIAINNAPTGVSFNVGGEGGDGTNVEGGSSVDVDVTIDLKDNQASDIGGGTIEVSVTQNSA